MLPREYFGDVVAPDDLRSFYFVRHGQTDCNKLSTVEAGERQWIAQGGGSDTDLNAIGEMQARRAGRVLAKLDIVNIICSPLRRTIQTAKIAMPECPIQLDDNLAERAFGQYEGKFAPIKLFEDNFDDCENTVAFSLRVANALKHTRNEGTLLVAHGGVLRVIAALLGVYLLEEYLGNACVLLFNRDGREWSVRAIDYIETIKCI